MEPATLSIVIPAYNEATRIGAAIDASLAHFDDRGIAGELIVVDDGSTDETPALVQGYQEKDARVRLVRLPENRGKGAAVRAGMLGSVGRRALFMDADLSTPLGELLRLEQALDGGADVAIGSRALLGSRIERRQHPGRELMGKTFNLLVRWLALSGFRDTQCGFKLFTRQAADTLFAEARVDRFAFDVEILLLARGRFRVVEVPVVWRHMDHSKVSPLRDAARMALDLLLVRIWTRRRRRAG
jgi:dolichyl-phosphate beta-glucosyltransferase